jgi:hypothetical protein
VQRARLAQLAREVQQRGAVLLQQRQHPLSGVDLRVWAARAGQQWHVAELQGACAATTASGCASSVLTLLATCSSASACWGCTTAACSALSLLDASAAASSLAGARSFLMAFKTTSVAEVAASSTAASAGTITGAAGARVPALRATRQWLTRRRLQTGPLTSADCKAGAHTTRLARCGTAIWNASGPPADHRTHRSPSHSL